jgi:hypothetical protein
MPVVLYDMGRLEERREYHFYLEWEVHDCGC